MNHETAAAITIPKVTYTDTRLKNGLRVIVSPDRAVPVVSVARKYLDPKRLQIVAVGDAAKIGPNLQSFGPLEVLDDEGKAVKASP